MGVITYLCATNAAAAIDFYKQALGAVENGPRMLDPQGRIGHSSFVLSGQTFYLSDEHPDIGVLSPQTLGGSPTSFVVDVTDVDAAYKQAFQAGAESVSEPEDQFYGARSASVLDPYGFRWSLQAATETLSDAELQSRVGDSFEVISPSD